VLFSYRACGGVGDTKFRSSRFLTPVEPPLPFEYDGRKGSFQVYGRGRPLKPALLRVGFRAPLATPRKRGADGEPCAYLVSRPCEDLEVNPHGWEPVDAEPLGLDGTYVAFANLRKATAILTGPGTIEALMRLRDVLDVSPTAVLVTPTLVQVDKLCGPRDTADQLRLVHRVVGLLDTLPWKPEKREGTIPAGPRPRLSLATGSCEVCRHRLALPLAVCAGCCTPHHLECWRYTGGCATYACLRRVAYELRSMADLDEFLRRAPPVAAEGGHGLGAVGAG
jgi:hypothetical protein